MNGSNNSGQKGGERGEKMEIGRDDTLNLPVKKPRMIAFQGSSFFLFAC